MANRLYIFIDESEDAGDVLEAGASSSHYAELALQLNDSGLDDLLVHLINWKYVLGKYFEAKSLPKGKQLARYINPIIELYERGDLCCSCVHLIKANYTGPYLKPSSPSGKNTVWFRNFVHRQLLEYHFKVFPPQNQEIQLIFDRFKMSRDAAYNLDEYLINNWNLPTFEHICHVDSIYTEPIQLASQLVNAVRDIILGIADEERLKLLGFITLKNITIL